MGSVLADRFLFNTVPSTTFRLLNDIVATLPRSDVSPTPAWASRALLRSSERSKPPFDTPRLTQSLCPACNGEAIQRVLHGSDSADDFAEKPGVVDAAIVEEAGRIVMKKTCARHGSYEDVLSTNPDLTRRMESLYFGNDFECEPSGVGPFAMKSGRGIALIADLTNRCNLKCSPCFMDANHAPYVHEPSLADLRAMIDRAQSTKPHRDTNLLFAGGEPTIATHFFDALAYAKTAGVQRVGVVTNGIRFAQEDGFAERARDAGLHQVYLQLDGASNAAHLHRGAANLFEVKHSAMENIARAGMKTNLQATVVNGINNQHVGDIVRFAVDQIDKVRSVLFQPIMFTGRDAGIRSDIRYARRYTLADLASDLQQQCSSDWHPTRDWFPMSLYSVFGHLFDVMNPHASRGSVYADFHPSQGVFSPLLVNQRTKQVVPMAALFNVEGLVGDVIRVTDVGGPVAAIRAQIVLSILRHFDPRRAPAGFTVGDLLRLFEQFLPRFRSDVDDWSARDNTYPEWRLLMVTGIWFQDLFNYDFAVTAMDPVRTIILNQGEISFCAYNSAGWRQIVEHFQKTANLGQWHKTRGRHRIYANGAIIPLRIQNAQEGSSRPAM